jgi:hypothetical protein
MTQAAQSTISQVNTPSDILYEVLEDEVVLLNLSTERYYILDDIGTRMWQVIVEHRSLDKAVQQLMSEYDVDETTLRRDLTTLIDQLVEHKLLAIQR